MAEATRGGGLVEPAAAAELTDRRFLLRCYGMLYLGVVCSLLDAVQVQPGEVIRDVGCGSGVVTRWVARQTGGTNRLVGVDINAYLGCRQQSCGNLR
jgi:2-polyprenyl-3-methyl-5-hydroxy-6-metoxy-1,4-benzoquinol methylase